VLINQIVNHQVASIDDIASRVRISPAEVLYDIQEMAGGGSCRGTK